jgi:hypothetical protein
MFGQKKDKLLALCENCGCKRYTKCGCQIGDPNSQTQKKKKHRKELK